LSGKRGCTLLDHIDKLLRPRDLIHQFPLPGAIGTHAFGCRAEHIRKIATHLSLVGQPRQSAGAGQHAEQRNFREAHGRGTIVDHQDFVAGQCEFVAAAGDGAIYRGEKFQAAVTA